MPSLLLWTMALATGLCAANLYYCQPLLELIQKSLGGSPARLGLIPTLTQVGYAIGMLLIVPVGDMIERKKLILFFTLLSAVALFVMGSAPTLWIAIAASLSIGVTTMTPQLIIPFAAHLAPEKQRGQVVGTVMSGLLFGILLARTVAGFVGAAFGWRAMFYLASLIVTLLAAQLAWVLPKGETTFQGNYAALFRSIFKIVREQKDLREASIFGGSLFAAFSAFWATLIFLMSSDHYGMGARAVGLFGILGAVGALVAPLIGKLADRRSPRATTGIGILVTMISFVIYWIWGRTSLVALGIGVVLMDIGVQSGHISNQTRVFALIPEARSRLNTVYMFTYFTSGALGSWLASLAWGGYGWPGVCVVALGFLSLGGAVFLLNNKGENRVETSLRNHRSESRDWA